MSSHKVLGSGCDNDNNSNVTNRRLNIEGMGDSGSRGVSDMGRLWCNGYANNFSQPIWSQSEA